LGESGTVRARLSDVLLLEVTEVGDNLSRRHAVGDEVMTVRHRNAEAADGGPARQQIRILSDPVRTSSPRLDYTARASGQAERLYELMDNGALVPWRDTSSDK
jgi:hypothetical protein